MTSFLVQAYTDFRFKMETLYKDQLVSSNMRVVFSRDSSMEKVSFVVELSLHCILARLFLENDRAKVISDTRQAMYMRGSFTRDVDTVMESLDMFEVGEKRKGLESSPMGQLIKVTGRTISATVSGYIDSNQGMYTRYIASGTSFLID
jgi:hypothetical protein